MSFITETLVNGQYNVTIDGKGQGAIKTCIDRDSVVQLSAARQEVSGFQWMGRKVRQVEIKNTIIYDRLDLTCLEWFITSGIQVDLSKTFVSPDALDDLNDMCDRLSRQKIKVVSGSVISLPTLGGYSGMGRISGVQIKCEDIGFKVLSKF